MKYYVTNNEYDTTKNIHNKLHTNIFGFVTAFVILDPFSTTILWYNTNQNKNKQHMKLLKNITPIIADTLFGVNNVAANNGSLNHGNKNDNIATNFYSITQFE